MNKFILLVGALCGMTFAATAQYGMVFAETAQSGAGREAGRGSVGRDYLVRRQGLVEVVFAGERRAAGRCEMEGRGRRDCHRPRLGADTDARVLR